MNVYLYRAALHCEFCAGLIRNRLTPPATPEDESSFDSDEYPKGLYPNGGGEADCPQHCDTCGTFLENPLTIIGREYVRARLRNADLPLSSVLEGWASFYDIGEDVHSNPAPEAEASSAPVVD